VRPARSKRFNPLSLDALNFLLADVRGALGSYLNVFLVTQQHWSQSQVGLVTTIGGVLGIAVQTPIGAAIDETRAKRGAIVLALVVLAIGAAVIFAWPSFWPVTIANSLMAMVGDVFGPAVAALTLGVYARKQLAKRIGRNSAFDHAGNVAIAAVAAWSATCSRSAPSSCSCRCSRSSPPSRCCRFRPPRSIMPARATSAGTAMRRGPRPTLPPMASCSNPGRWWCSGCGVMLFHLANAALLPLVGQKLAAAHPDEATAMMSACIVAAQAVMLPIALMVGRTADGWGASPCSSPVSPSCPCAPCSTLSPTTVSG